MNLDDHVAILLKDLLTGKRRVPSYAEAVTGAKSTLAHMLSNKAEQVRVTNPDEGARDVAIKRARANALEALADLIRATIVVVEGNE